MSTPHASKGLPFTATAVAVVTALEVVARFDLLDEPPPPYSFLKHIPLAPR